MGRPRKPEDQRHNRTTKALEAVNGGLASVSELIAEVPPPHRGWLTTTRQQWSELWGSPLAGHMQATDHPALYRCFDWRDELVRCHRRADALRKKAEEQAIVEGSKGQPVANPLWGVAEAWDRETLTIETKIVALEDRLGLSPKARLNIGVTQQRGLSLAAQNAKVAEALREAMSSDASDPRAVARDTAVEAS